MTKIKLTLALLLAGALAAPCCPTRADEAEQQQPTPPLPLRDVVLFNSGVGYFARSGKIDGDATLNLSFRAEQINDVLKSLVLLDPSGKVRPVTYTTQDPLARRQSGLGIALGRDFSLGQILQQFQGARVKFSVSITKHTATGTETSSGTGEGTLMSVNTKNVISETGGTGATTTPVEFFNIYVDGGLCSYARDDIVDISLLDPRLNKQFQDYLVLLGAHLDNDRRNVQIRFGGGASREVRAGYLLETPVWKTSYRLVLGDGRDKTAKPYLQGWAIVENTTDDDWQDVHLSLVAGRPISFIQDLYAPLYIPRPVVEPQVVGSPVPQTYGEDLKTADEAAAAPAADKGDKDEETSRKKRAAPQAQKPAPMPPGAVLAPEDSATGLIENVKAQAQGGTRGELFEYAINQPVTLPRQQAAMVPIVTENIGGEKLSIYDADSAGDRALNGFRLRNTSGLHLAGGPITIFQDGAYAGDAQIEDMGPNDTRLLSYAVDLELTVSHADPISRQETLSFVAKGGVLVISRKEHREQIYTFHNKAASAKKVLVQQNIDPAFKLVAPAKPEETTATAYRFKLEVAPGTTGWLKVVTEQPLSETVVLLNLDFNTLVAYARNTQLPQQLKDALQQLVALRRKVTDLQARRGRLEGEIQTISQEQERIRQNMDRLEHNNPLYLQYVKKMTEQETRIESLREEIAKSREAENAAQKDVRDYTDALTTE